MSEPPRDLAATLPEHADPCALLRGRSEQSEFDVLTDVLLPTLLFFMLGALVWFMLDVVSARFEAPYKQLRLIVFFFLIAVVGIARLKARGGDLSAGAYGLALVAVMGLCCYLFSYGGGAFGGGYGGRHPLALMLALDALVVAIWFGAHYLVEQTAIDPDDEELQSAGLLSSDEWARHGQGATAIAKRANPGRAVMVLSLLALLIFGGGHRLLAGHEYQAHAFWCMVVFLGSALLVLALASLAGLECYLRGRGARLPWTVTALWLLLAAPLAAGMLGLAQVAPKLEPRADSFLPQLPEWMAEWTLPGNAAMVDAPWLGEAPPSNDPNAFAKGGDDRTGAGGLGGGSAEGRATERSSRETGPTSSGESRGRGEGGAGSMAGRGGADGTGGENDGRAAGEGEGPGNTGDPDGPPRLADEGRPTDQGDEPQMTMEQETPEASVAQPDAETASDEAGGALDPSDEPPAAADSEANETREQAATEPRPAREPGSETTQEAIERDDAEPEEPRREQAGEPVEQPSSPAAEGLGKVFGLLLALGVAAAMLYGVSRLAGTRVGAWWAAHRPEPKPRPLKLRDVFRDPFSPRSPLRDRPPGETVVHVYRAFLAYCELIGKPRRAALTAHEFLFELPASVESWRPMIVALTELYEAVEYTPELIGDDVLETLWPIWERLMMAVREVRR